MAEPVTRTMDASAAPDIALPAPPARRPWLSPLNQRRWRNFTRNRRAYWSLWIFAILFGLSLFAEFIANDRPILVRYQGEWFTPIFSFYPETTFGGDFRTEAVYGDVEVRCLIMSGGLESCFDDPEGILAQAETGTINDIGRAAPSPPDGTHLLGTDDTARDVLARVIYGFRLSILFTLMVTGLYIIIIMFAILGRSFWLLVFLTALFGWPALVGVVRAEFLRARNFEYVRAARALGVSSGTIMFRHMLPNAMVATVTLLPFIITGTIGTLASLDFLGFGLPSSAPSLGELTLQAKQNLQAPWLAFTAFITFAVMLSLLVFIFEGIRDAFDPRKTFQ